MKNFPLRYNVYLTSISMLIIFFLSMHCQAYAQREDDLSSLQQKTRSELINNITEVSSKEAIIYEKELLKKLKTDIERAKLYEELSRTFLKQGDTKRSTAYVNEAIFYAQSITENEILINLYILLGNSELIASNNQKALDAYYTALEIAQKEGEIGHRVVVINPNIAIIRRRMRQLSEALDACNEALAAIPTTNYYNTRDHVNLLTIVSEVHLDIQQSEISSDMQQYDTVLKYVNQGISMSNLLDYNTGLIDLYTKKGTVYFYKKNYEEALRYLNTADRIYNENTFNNIIFKTNINYFLASCLVAQGDYEKSIQLLQQLIDLKGDNDPKKYTRLINAYKLLAISYENLGDHKSSSYWYGQFNQLNEKYQKDKDAVVNSIYEKDTEFLGERIETLEDQKAKQKRTAIYFLSLLIVVSGICVLILYRYKKKQRSSKQSFDKLLEKVNQLEKSSKESLKPKEPGRKVIIDDQKVHDVLKGLKRLEEQEFYLSTECSLRSMAKKVKTNATYLSKIINTHKGLSYNDYINNLRIDYAVNRLKNDKKFRSFSIKSIATELGYKSDYSFAKHFKSKTGINPSYYIKKIEGV